MYYKLKSLFWLYFSYKTRAADSRITQYLTRTTECKKPKLQAGKNYLIRHFTNVQQEKINKL